MHRDPEFFPEPEKFNPERFSSENEATIRPYTYLPFGAGPRNCIGMRLAMQAVKLCLLHSVHKVQFVRVEKTQADERSIHCTQLLSRTPKKASPYTASFTASSERCPRQGKAAPPCTLLREGHLLLKILDGLRDSLSENGHEVNSLKQRYERLHRKNVFETQRQLVVVVVCRQWRILIHVDASGLTSRGR
ncbi:hypothetical protein HPB48_026225 [Haemaphysalis longicornis]|uniref:Cytochrome P450 n=1 Tax=Haemaphysalis longicornis TaxID=44386 RepID=A0A9J6HBJ3_HAELO|nr:hypothetical protein HPB48_026225 [Haemaphysalis longicornis]